MRRNTRILVCILFFVLLAIYFSIRDKWALHRIVDIAPDLEVLAVLLVIALVISMPQSGATSASSPSRRFQLVVWRAAHTSCFMVQY